ncbi:MAG TPA: isoprenyl transferase [Gammaproteobacteria bacterium]|nr:isoprenyl transferase [Gammaproteobacteria bacterium]
MQETPILDTLPTHLAVIMDGNGRWATERGLPRVAGHRKGAEAVRKLVRYCADLGIPNLTVFAFSSENWQRPAHEVSLLLELFVQMLDKEVRSLHKNGIRFRVLGDISRFPQKIQQRIGKAQQLTASNTKLCLNIAASYGGRWDITQACRSIAESVSAGLLDAEQITEGLLQSCLSTESSPDPDLFIRTGGERRISNFLLWQLAYAELYFVDDLWPDFDERSLLVALTWFSSRQRRFGMTREQLQAAGSGGNA